MPERNLKDILSNLSYQTLTTLNGSINELISLTTKHKNYDETRTLLDLAEIINSYSNSSFDESKKTVLNTEVEPNKNELDSTDYLILNGSVEELQNDALSDLLLNEESVEKEDTFTYRFSREGKFTNSDINVAKSFLLNIFGNRQCEFTSHYLIEQFGISVQETDPEYIALQNTSRPRWKDLQYKAMMQLLSEEIVGKVSRNQYSLKQQVDLEEKPIIDTSEIDYYRSGI